METIIKSIEQTKEENRLFEEKIKNVLKEQREAMIDYVIKLRKFVIAVKQFANDFKVYDGK